MGPEEMEETVGVDSKAFSYEWYKFVGTDEITLAGLMVGVIWAGSMEGHTRSMPLEPAISGAGLPDALVGLWRWIGMGLAVGDIMRLPFQNQRKE
jgi:hypothetical protein